MSPVLWICALPSHFQRSNVTKQLVECAACWMLGPPSKERKCVVEREAMCGVCAWVRPLLWQLQEVQDEPGLFQVSSQWIYAVVIRFEAVFCCGGFGCI